MKRLIFMVCIAGALSLPLLNCGGNSKDQTSGSSEIEVDSMAIAKEAALARLDSIRQDSIDNASAGLTFQTICHPEKVEGITLQTLYSPSILEKNLIILGFKQVETKKEYKRAYDDEFVEVIIKTFSKTVGNRTTRVSFDDWDGYTGELEIYFPNEKDVEEFKKTVNGKLHDDRVYYYSHKITYSGTKVTIESDGAE